MGMYTEFYGTIELRKGLKKQLLNECGVVEWHKLKKVKVLRNHPDILAFLKLKRADLIGCSESASFDVDHINNFAWDRMLDLPNSPDRYRFHCSIKNYCGSIEGFCKILPLIAEWWELYSLYEEVKYDREPNLFMPTITKKEKDVIPNHINPNPAYCYEGTVERKLGKGRYLRSTFTPGRSKNSHEILFY